ncbi:hypothetical protein D7V88_12365 [Corallococcus terminator]|uniref:Uncharacterized protein n=1 Tax=Corallococcus terminator TaxID=2316733 RepID=A0A3A8J1P7_9BACT|nr:hypothetical protein D7V88_12365 [Corallococcus terminator]
MLLPKSGQALLHAAGDLQGMPAWDRREGALRPGLSCSPPSRSADAGEVSNLFNSLGHALGDASLDHFGLEFSTRIAPGPLSELYG